MAGGFGFGKQVVTALPPPEQMYDSEPRRWWIGYEGQKAMLCFLDGGKDGVFAFREHSMKIGKQEYTWPCLIALGQEKCPSCDKDIVGAVKIFTHDAIALTVVNMTGWTSGQGQIQGKNRRELLVAHGDECNRFTTMVADRCAKGEDGLVGRCYNVKRTGKQGSRLGDSWDFDEFLPEAARIEKFKKEAEPINYPEHKTIKPKTAEEIIALIKQAASTAVVEKAPATPDDATKIPF